MHGELCRLLSHLINITGVITILTYSFFSIKGLLGFPAEKDQLLFDFLDSYK
jgi:hypothetical protein